MRPLTPYQEKPKARGPRLEPLAELKRWLEAQPGVLRVPLTLERGAPRGWTRAWLGPLEVKVSDSALGVSLADRLQVACPGEGECRVWVEGRWRDGKFHVLHFSRAIRPGEDADFVEYEVEAPTQR